MDLFERNIQVICHFKPHSESIWNWVWDMKMILICMDRLWWCQGWNKPLVCHCPSQARKKLSMGYDNNMILIWMLCQAWQCPDGAMDQIVQVSQKIYKKFEHMICKNECVLYIESMAIGKAMPRGFQGQNMKLLNQHV